MRGHDLIKALQELTEEQLARPVWLHVEGQWDNTVHVHYDPFDRDIVISYDGTPYVEKQPF